MLPRFDRLLEAPTVVFHVVYCTMNLKISWFVMVVMIMHVMIDIEIVVHSFIVILVRFKFVFRKGIDYILDLCNAWFFNAIDLSQVHKKIAIGPNKKRTKKQNE